MTILTELHDDDGICSVIPAHLVPTIKERLPLIIPKLGNTATWRFLASDSWVGLDFDKDNRTGLDQSLICLNQPNYGEEPGDIQLGWDPGKIESAMQSLNILDVCLPYSERSRRPDSADLVVSISMRERGWNVLANFGEPIWDVIEQPFFVELLPEINVDLRRFWEVQSGRERPGQYTTVFDGLHGKTIQVCLPSTNCPTLSGSRNHTGEYQMRNEYADSVRDAHTLVFSLGLILNSCRQHLAVPVPV